MQKPVWFVKALRGLPLGRNSPKNEEEERAQKFRNLGWVHYLEEDYESAQRNLRLACNHSQDSNFLLGHVYFNGGQYGEAVAYYKKAIEYAESDPALRNKLAFYHCFLGNAYRKQSDFDAALRELDKAELEIEWLEKANQAGSANDHNETSADDQKTIFLSRLATAYIELYSSNPKAKPELKLDILERAKKASEQALCLRPKAAEFLNDLGVVHYCQADHAASASANGNEKAKDFLEKTKTRFERATKENAEPNRKAVFYLDLAATYVYLGRFSESGEKQSLYYKNARDNFYKGLKQDSNNAELHARLGDLQTETEQYGEAISHYVEAIELVRKAGGNAAEGFCTSVR